MKMNFGPVEYFLLNICLICVLWINGSLLEKEKKNRLTIQL